MKRDDDFLCFLAALGEHYARKSSCIILLAPDELGCTVKPLWSGELGLVLSKHLNQL